MKSKSAFKCKHKGCVNIKPLAKGYCRKHYVQFNLHGRTFDNTKSEFNTIVYVEDHIELVITDKKGYEKGRTKIDIEDLLKAKSIGRWCINSSGYVCHGVPNVFLHHIVSNIELKQGEQIDHIKTGAKGKLDNRKGNLRLATGTQNQYNRDKRRDNTSGYVGVCFKKSSGKWAATLAANGKNKHLGYFATAKEASKVREKAAKKLHGDFYHKKGR